MNNSIFFTYRRSYTNRGVEYDVSYFNDKMYEDYKLAGITEMIDGERFIPTSRITKEITPGIKWKRKAGVLKYIDGADAVDLQATLLQTGATFGLEIKTRDEMLQWISDNTDLVEEISTPGKFLIAEADGDMILEDKYLII